MTTKTEVTCRSLRELDALVAEYVTKLEDQYVANGYTAGCLKRNSEAIPHYTTWAGLESVVPKVEEVGLIWHWGILTNGGYWVDLWLPESDYMADLPEVSTTHKDKAVAFCLAALASVGVRVKLELGGEHEGEEGS
jgi:hypothetical protein